MIHNILKLVEHMSYHLYHDDSQTCTFPFNLSTLKCFITIFPLQQANVMLEYTLDDAQGVLQKNLEVAESSLEKVENDLGFIRDQTTTIEVSILSD